MRMPSLSVHTRHALTGCQLCQLALWFFAGTAKIGPWMKYVMCFMMPNSLAMRITDALGDALERGPKQSLSGQTVTAGAVDPEQLPAMVRGAL